MAHLWSKVQLHALIMYLYPSHVKTFLYLQLDFSVDLTIRVMEQHHSLRNNGNAKKTNRNAFNSKRHIFHVQKSIQRKDCWNNEATRMIPDDFFNIFIAFNFSAFYSTQVILAKQSRKASLRI